VSNFPLLYTYTTHFTKQYITKLFAKPKIRQAKEHRQHLHSMPQKRWWRRLNHIVALWRRRQQKEEAKSKKKEFNIPYHPLPGSNRRLGVSNSHYTNVSQSPTNTTPVQCLLFNADEKISNFDVYIQRISVSSHILRQDFCQSRMSDIMRGVGRLKRRQESRGMASQAAVTTAGT
jgi:hypothetical protein